MNDSTAKYLQNDVKVSRPLYESLIPMWLYKEVVSCEEAANAKNVPLQNELKTLVLKTSKGLYAVHLCGNQRLSLRSVKKHLNVKEAHLLSILEMSEIGLTRGTVCPFLPPVLRMKQLVSLKLLELEFVTTNNGTLIGYFVFPPEKLLEVPFVETGNFDSDIPNRSSSV